MKRKGDNSGPARPLVVWVVDDHPLQRDALREIVVHVSRALAVALDGREIAEPRPFDFVSDAIAEFRRTASRPDVIVADLVMKERPDDREACATAGGVALWQWFENESKLPPASRPFLLLTTNNEQDDVVEAIRPLLAVRATLPPRERWFDYMVKSWRAKRSDQPAGTELSSDHAWATCFKIAVVEWIKRLEGSGVPEFDFEAGFGPVFPLFRSQVEKVAGSPSVLLAGTERWERMLFAQLLHRKTRRPEALVTCSLRFESLDEKVQEVSRDGMLFVDAVTPEHYERVLRLHLAPPAARPRTLLLGGDSLAAALEQAGPDTTAAALREAVGRAVLKLEQDLAAWTGAGARYLAEQFLRAEERRLRGIRPGVIEHTLEGAAGEFLRFGTVARLREAMNEMADSDLDVVQLEGVAEAPPAAEAASAVAPVVPEAAAGDPDTTAPYVLLDDAERRVKIAGKTENDVTRQEYAILYQLLRYPLGTGSDRTAAMAQTNVAARNLWRIDYDVFRNAGAYSKTLSLLRTRHPALKEYLPPADSGDRARHGRLQNFAYPDARNGKERT